MPSAAVEMLLPRAAWWIMCGIVAVFAAFLTVGAVDLAVGADAEARRWALVVAAVAGMFWIVVADLFILVLYRPRRDPVSVRASTTEVEVPGSRRFAGWTLATAVVWLVGACIIAVAVDAAWRVFWIIVAVLLLAVVIDHLLSIGHVRRAVLTRNGVRATSFRIDAEVAWDDIAALRWTQATGGLMVARIEVKSGAASYVEHWRHPFARRRDTIDVELPALDLDPLLVMMALQLYWLMPTARAELATGRVPARLFDADLAVGSVPAQLGTDWLASFRPRGQR